MNCFIKDDEHYIRVIPSKFMMNSTMIYDIVTRGDILALRVSDQKLVVFKGTEKVEHTTMFLMPTAAQIAKEMGVSQAPRGMPNHQAPLFKLTDKD